VLTGLAGELAVVLMLLAVCASLYRAARSTRFA
jgi:hypothetical protein